MEQLQEFVKNVASVFVFLLLLAVLAIALCCIQGCRLPRDSGTGDSYCSAAQAIAYGCGGSDKPAPAPARK